MRFSFEFILVLLLLLLLLIGSFRQIEKIIEMILA